MSVQDQPHENFQFPEEVLLRGNSLWLGGGSITVYTRFSRALSLNLGLFITQTGSTTQQLKTKLIFKTSKLEPAQFAEL
jgi:hypothetical protein